VYLRRLHPSWPEAGLGVDAQQSQPQGWPHYISRVSSRGDRTRAWSTASSVAFRTITIGRLLAFGAMSELPFGNKSGQGMRRGVHQAHEVDFLRQRGDESYECSQPGGAAALVRAGLDLATPRYVDQWPKPCSVQHEAVRAHDLPVHQNLNGPLARLGAALEV